MATYQLLARRVARYTQLQRHLTNDVQITVTVSQPVYRMPQHCMHTAP